MTRLRSICLWLWLHHFRLSMDLLICYNSLTSSGELRVRFIKVPVSRRSDLGEVLMLDTATNQIVDTINLGYALLQAIAVAPTAPFACAIGNYGNNDEGQVYLIDISPK